MPVLTMVRGRVVMEEGRIVEVVLQQENAQEESGRAFDQGVVIEVQFHRDVGDTASPKGGRLTYSQ